MFIHVVYYVERTGCLTIHPHMPFSRAFLAACFISGKFITVNCSWSCFGHFFGIVLLIQPSSNLDVLIEFFVAAKKKFPLLLHMCCTSFYVILFIYLFISLVS